VSHPHHTLSNVGLIGAGHVPMPGEVSFAPHGVRCLEVRPECRRGGLEVLCHPIEEGVVTDILPRLIHLVVLAAPEVRLTSHISR
jgi:predicted ATPase with chaperone activity